MSLFPAPPAAVAGLDGGADGGPIASPPPAAAAAAAAVIERAGEVVCAGVSTREGGPDPKPIVGGVACETLIGGVPASPGITDGKGGTGGVAVLDADAGGPPAALTALLGGPLGGGAFGASAAAGVGPFLLTHFFSSLS